MSYASAAAPLSRPLPAIKRVLFATDFSACSKAAMPYACALARTYGAKLHVINVVGPEPLVGPMGVPYTDPEQEHETARRQLRALTEGFAFAPVQTECSVHRGDVSDAVCRIVEEDKSDLLVVGTHGRHGVKQFVMGSVAERLFRNVACPVLTIGPGATRTVAEAADFENIMVATDLSPASVKVVQYAESLARGNDAALLVFHVIPDGFMDGTGTDTSFDDQIVAARKRLQEIAPKNLRKVDTSIRIGMPAELIVQTATDREVDLIIIGARRGPKLAAHVPWAIAHEVVCAAPCPVLTVGH